MRKCLELLTIIFLVLLQIPVTLANDVDKQILYSTFNGEYTVADSLITKQIEVTPNNPKYYYLKANLAFYSRYFGNSGLQPGELIDVVAENAQKAIDLAKDLQETTELKFYLGSAYGLLSRAQFIKNRSVYDAFSSARKSKKYLKEVIEEEPDYHDAYLGLAVLEYFSSTRLTSWWQKSVAWVTGMSGDKEKSMKYFTQTAEKGQLCKTEAQFILATLYRFLEQDQENAKLYISRFIVEHPQNTFMSNLYIQLELEELIDQNGIAFLKENLDSLKKEYKINSDNALNRLGYNYINKEDLESALAIFKLNVQLYPDVANCYDSLGECHLLLGNKDEALKNYQIAYQKVDSDTTRNEAGRAALKENIETQLKQLNAI